MTRTRKIIWCVAVLLAVATTYYSIWWQRQQERWLANRKYAHQHCIKATAMALSAYANSNDGKYPFHTNGWGDALLLLVKSNYADISLICGPTDNGRVFREALEKGTDVPEELCSRVYVQGLNRTNAYGVLVLFDRKSFPGGDHFYGLLEPRRECLDGDLSMQTLDDKLWPKSSRQSVERLVELGFSREDAEAYFPEAKPQ